MREGDTLGEFLRHRLESKSNIGDACVGEGIVRVLLRRLLEISQGFLKIFACPPVPKIASLEIKLMRFRVLGRLRRDCASLGTRELRLSVSADRLRDFAFDAKIQSAFDRTLPPRDAHHLPL